MADAKKTEKAVETAAEVKAPAKRTAAKKTAEKKTAEKKTAEKKAAAPKKTAEKKTAAPKRAAAKKTAATVYVQYLGAELTTEAIVAKAIDDAAIKAPKTVNVYVKPEENKVYYVIDGKEGSFFLV